MKKITAYLKLFRIQNLLIIVLLMYFVRYFILLPVYKYGKIDLAISDFNFFLFVLGYVLIVAGGYAINDYYDIGIDETNKPEKTVLRKDIPLSHGKISYFILTIIGFIISLIVILNLGVQKLLFILLIITFMFWFYSTKYKREFLIGNIVVAFLSGMSIALVWFYEFFASVSDGRYVSLIRSIKFINYAILAYFVFAFILTFIREVIKDIVDIEGDKEFKCDNLPIRLGIKKSKNIAIIMSFIAIFFIFFALAVLASKEYWYIFYYTLIIISGLLSYIIFKLFKAEDKEQFKHISDLLKVLFLAGIVSMQLFSVCL